MARRYKRPRATIKWEYSPRWGYVRERLLDPGVCAKSSYRTLSKSNVPHVPEGVLLVTCCPKGSRRNPRGQCCAGASCRSSVTQAIRHSVGRFRFRHKEIWAALQRAKPGRGGVKVVWGREMAPAIRRRRAA